MILKNKISISSLSFFAIVLIISLLITNDFIVSLSFLNDLESKLIDKRFSERGEIEIRKNADVTICTIDQESFDQLPEPFNKYPLNRIIFAKAIENLNSLGAKVIGIDVLMPTYDQFSKKNDEIFSNAIKKFGNVVLAGKIDEQFDSNRLYDFSNSSIKYNFSNVYYDADSSIGIVRVVPDRDNVYRRYLPSIKLSSINLQFPSFGFEILNKFYGIKKNTVAKDENDFFVLGKKKIPKYDDHSMFVNIYGPNNSFPTVKLIDIIDDESFKTKDEIDYGVDINRFDAIKNDSSIIKLIKNKIILIGSTMPEDRDLLASSFSIDGKKGTNILYGVEFHANAIQNVVSNDFLYKQTNSHENIFVIIFVTISFWATYLIRKVKIRFSSLLEIMNFLFTAFMIFILYELGVYFFIHQKLIVSIVYPSLATFLGYIGSTSFFVLKERKQNQLIKNVFSQYVNKQVVQELLSNANNIKLGGDKKNVTIMFSDMVGFTSFAENKEPELLVKFINGLLNELTNVILDNNGTLDKYMGDAVMAFWGAPINLDNHAYLACKSAIEMQNKVKELSQLWEEKGEKSLKIRIGINTGEVIVGNVGGEKHKNYTVMGDEVNLASRLEGANKEYSTLMMISESTYESVKEEFIARELDLIRVKGKSKPTKVYELIGLKNDESAVKKLSELKIYFEGLKLYRQRNFEDAKKIFVKSFKLFKDEPSKIYAERCEHFISNPPKENWDGVFEMKSK